MGVQKAWTADFMRRWRKVQQASNAAYASIFENPFMLRELKADADDIRRFMGEFDRALTDNLGGDWQDEYIDPAYARGMQDGSRALRQAGITTAIMSAEALATRRQSPANTDRALILRNTAKEEVQGIAAATSQQSARIIREGVAARANRSEILHGINGRIEHVGRTRSKILAKTETVRAHHKAKVQMYRDEGVKEVTIMAEWVTAGDDRVCPICAPMEGRNFTLNEIEGLIPAHAGCRCSTVPVEVRNAA